eukprot:1147805-Pyramimonas_sp.AAC.1
MDSRQPKKAQDAPRGSPGDPHEARIAPFLRGDVHYFIFAVLVSAASKTVQEAPKTAPRRP